MLLKRGESLVPHFAFDSDTAAGKYMINQRYLVTFDIDWAPDTAIELCLSILRKNGSKAIFFATHKTDMNLEILRQGHELGIHPNFLPGSSQGNCFEEIMDYCLSCAPEASVMRTHSLVQSTPLLQKIFGLYKQLTVDLSTLTYRFKHVERFPWRFSNVEFERINYNWEDDIEFSNPNFNWQRPEFFGETTIFNYHPIHVALNSSVDTNYRGLIKELNGSPLFLAKHVLLDKFGNKASGTQDHLEAVLQSSKLNAQLEDIH